MTRTAVFLDRDGTVIEHVHHLHRREDVRLVAGAAAAIRRLRSCGHLAILATNQSVVGRGLLSAEGLAEIHSLLQRLLLREGAQLDAVYWNPHPPPEQGQLCHPDRKPQPGMLLRAAKEHGIDLVRSWMVGDSISDALAGRAAGCRAILVGTGLGRRAETPADPRILWASDLAEAAAIVAADIGGSDEAASR